ncbi:SMP-30/gluconolactonase/LRE family protein [Lichenicoccus sp.]|uniref:SMP-30/gluconolactonase/LRE family protein n=1 Tax=Lichenicoccus sp. TaxID=2781899 RepID=UPI003D0AA7F4
MLYVSDTALWLGQIPNAGTGVTHEIIAFDVAEAGALSNRRFFCHTDHGHPDGFAIDRRSWVWTSAADGVHVWSAERERLGFIPTAQTVSDLCFGGSGRRRLFMAATTSCWRSTCSADLRAHVRRRRACTHFACHFCARP